jgi:hypothetical protein
MQYIAKRALLILYTDLNNSNACLPPTLNPNIIFFSCMLTVPISKVFIKIVMIDMKQFTILHLRIIFIMKNFTGQQFELILKGWKSVIQLKNSNGNASITLFIPKVDFEK